MGLLERAQQLKESTDEKKKAIKKSEKEEKDITTTNKTVKVIKIDEKQEGNEQDGLLKKIQEKKRTISEGKDIITTNKPVGSEPNGLLSKVQEKKRLQSEKEKKTKDLEIIEKNDLITTNEREEVTIYEDKLEVPASDGLLNKVMEKRKILSEKKKFIGLDSKGKKEIIEEKTGFGWKGLGIRRIVFDHSINEYVYELDEPVLTDIEIEIKDELSRLFKMLADVNITTLEKHEKEKYLEETLEQIIIDNNIKFTRKKKEEKDEKKSKSFKDIFSFKKKDKKEKTSDKSESTDDKEGKKGKFSKKLFPLKRKDKKDKPKKEEKPKEKDKTENTSSKIKNLKKILTLSKKERELSKEEKEKQLVEEKKSKNKIFYHIFQNFLGYGRINIIMEDEGIEDISCDGHHVPIFIYHKKYDAIPTNIKYKNDKELDSFVVRLAQICGKQISIYSPIVDGKLPDGSRLQTTLARTVTRESTFTIRKFKENPLTPIDLISFQSLSLDMAAYFWMAIERGASILFCGGTASGKTTALNALSLFIPAQSKIISIEDTREVNLPHKNWIAGTTRQGFSASDEKTGKDIDMFDLIRAALRQRPKVVIVGEVRGKEAYSLFQAMATGHTSYATVHASDIHTLIQRLENPPISLPRALLTSLDIIVFQNAVDIAGKTVRRMTSVTEVVKLDPDTNQLIFMEPFRWISKTDDRFDSSCNSKVLNNIRLQNDWDEERLNQEIENRKKVLTWMIEKDIRDYMDVGRIVSDYEKYPEKILEIVEGEMKK